MPVGDIAAAIILRRAFCLDGRSRMKLQAGGSWASRFRNILDHQETPADVLTCFPLHDAM